MFHQRLGFLRFKHFQKKKGCGDAVSPVQHIPVPKEPGLFSFHDVNLDYQQNDRLVSSQYRLSWCRLYPALEIVVPAHR